jgi:beta-fructofuranosidase
MHTLRPRVHFAPEKNWINDPNGLCFLDGWYHMFYQYNPKGDQWGHIHWGHARSRDLLRWEELPPALIPDEVGGEQHCFSGSAMLVPGAPPRLYYTSIGYEDQAEYLDAVQKLAVGSPDMLHWPADSRQTILRNGDHPAEIGEIRDWRDPFVFREGDSWLMLIGALVDGRGSVMLYEQKDPENWEFRRILYQLDESGVILECPNLCRIGDRHVLFYSPDAAVRYVSGELTADFEFIPAKSGVVDFAGWQGYYAPQLLLRHGRAPVLIGWATEKSREGSDEIRGYNGAMAFPRVLGLDSGAGLIQDFHPILTEARQHAIEGKGGENGGLCFRPPENCVSLELQARLSRDSRAGDISIGIRYAGGHVLRISLDYRLRSMVLHRDGSSNREGIERSDIPAQLPEAPGEHSIHLLLDASLVEIIADRRSAICTRVYPHDPRIEEIHFSGAAEAEISAFTIS